MAKAAGERWWCAMCIIRNWCTKKGFWAPNGDDGPGKPGANKPPHASDDKPPNFVQLWPLILAHFHLLIRVLEIICSPWEKEQRKEVPLLVANLRFTSRRFELSRATELSTHRCVCQLFLSAIHCGEQPFNSFTLIFFIHRQHQSCLH